MYAPSSSKISANEFNSASRQITELHLPHTNGRRAGFKLIKFSMESKTFYSRKREEIPGFIRKNCFHEKPQHGFKVFGYRVSTLDSGFITFRGVVTNQITRELFKPDSPFMLKYQNEFRIKTFRIGHQS